MTCTTQTSCKVSLTALMSLHSTILASHQHTVPTPENGSAHARRARLPLAAASAISSVTCPRSRGQSRAHGVTWEAILTARKRMNATSPGSLRQKLSQRKQAWYTHSPEHDDDGVLICVLTALRTKSTRTPEHHRADATHMPMAAIRCVYRAMRYGS